MVAARNDAKVSEQILAAVNAPPIMSQETLKGGDVPSLKVPLFRLQPSG
jgi:hypothetical protein